MAVYAAHLTRTLQGTPSIFQVTAQEALGDTIKPALRKVFEYLAAVYPNKFDWPVRWYDELYLLFDLCLQYHYLKHYAASFSETFYGLLRVPILASNEFNSGQRLPEHLERWSLVMLVLVPYVRSKIEKLVGKWREDNEDGRLGKSKSDRARKAAIKLYAVVHLICEGARVVQLGRFVSGSSGGGHSHSPTLALLGLTLKNAPPRSEQHYSWADLTTSLLTGNVAGSAAAVTFPAVGGALLRAAEYGAFGVQLLRWWEGGGRPAASALRGPLPPLPPLPPVALPSVSREGSRRGGRMNACGVCGGQWSVPAALPVSGSVFCYSCVAPALRTAGACPLTGLPAAEDSLVRLYLND